MTTLASRIRVLVMVRVGSSKVFTAYPQVNTHIEIRNLCPVWFLAAVWSRYIHVVMFFTFNYWESAVMLCDVNRYQQPGYVFVSPLVFAPSRCCIIQRLMQRILYFTWMALKCLRPYKYLSLRQPSQQQYHKDYQFCTGDN